MKSAHHIMVGIGVIAASVCAGSLVSHAATETIVVEPPLHHYTLYLDLSDSAVFSFKSQIFDAIEPANWKVKVTVETTADTVTFEPKPGASLEDLRGQVTIITRMYTLMVTIRPAKTAEQVKRAVLVKHASLNDVVLMAAKKIASEQLVQANKRHEEELKKRENAHQADIDRVQRESTERTLLTEMHRMHATTRLLDDVESCDGEGVAICGQQWSPLDRYGVLRLVITNRMPDEIEIVGVQALDKQRIRDHASMVRIGDGQPAPSGSVRARLGRMETITVSVTLSEPKKLGDHIQLGLNIAGRAGPMFQTIDLRPPRPKPGEGLITLGLQGIAGAVWLANPVETDKLGATSTTGLALRVRYGFNRRVSFEGELAGARSGNAQFDGMMFEDQEGQIARSAALGRILVGGALHFGQKYRPQIRAGLGFQGVSHNSRFTPTGGLERSGPEVDFEVAGLWMVGLGLDARLSRNWTAGLGASFVGVATSLGGEGIEGSFEGGLHLSYGWTPR